MNPLRALVFGVVFLLGCGLARAQAPTPIELRVMSFNVWYGGEQVNFATVVEAIRAADADIVGVQEPDGNLARLAQAAGYAHIDPRRNIISRYPIFDPGAGVRTEPGAAPYGIAALDAAHVHAWVMVRPGEVAAVANTHLSSDPYGPEAVRDGSGRQDVLALEERVRMPEVRPLLSLGALARAGTPVFLTGDFNTPSHFDWTEAMQRVRPRVIRYTVDWPVTRALADAGLRDSYREAHPDPTVRLGYTWTAGMPAPYIRPGETIDRIDFVFAGGAAETLSSEIIGEAGGDGVDIAVTPYPSDHRGVVSTFQVIPIPAPALIAVGPYVARQGEDIMVRGYDPASEGWSAAIVPAGAPVTQAVLRIHEAVAAWRRAARFSSAELAPGEYDAVLLGADGQELKRTRFAVFTTDARPLVQALTRRVAQGAPVRVRWANAPGNRHDWIGIFAAGAPLGDYQTFAYVDARFAGEMAIPTETEDGPLPAGEYELRLMRDDSPTVMARAAFTIRN
ncbi:MAG: endonuclease/exonuclease/phosphatase family protein [Hyphomonadaceae bacterium]|nr:endonuclease/exonuclease/phosphatase family protein [Hyphomonadaceae bacterium]